MRNSEFGTDASIAFLAKPNNGAVYIYMMLEGGDEPKKFMGFIVSPKKARMFSDAIEKAALLAEAQMPEFPL